MNKWIFSQRTIVGECEKQSEIIVEDPTSEDVGTFVSLVQYILDGKEDVE